MATPAEIRKQIARTGLGLDVLWIGPLEPDEDLVAIVHDPLTERRYKWPGLECWREPLPSTPTAVEEVPQEVATSPNPRLVQKDLF